MTLPIPYQLNNASVLLVIRVAMLPSTMSWTEVINGYVFAAVQSVVQTESYVGVNTTRPLARAAKEGTNKAVGSSGMSANN